MLVHDRPALGLGCSWWVWVACAATRAERAPHDCRLAPHHCALRSGRAQIQSPCSRWKDASSTSRCRGVLAWRGARGTLGRKPSAHAHRGGTQQAASRGGVAHAALPRHAAWRACGQPFPLSPRQRRQELRPQAGRRCHANTGRPPGGGGPFPCWRVCPPWGGACGREREGWHRRPWRTERGSLVPAQRGLTAGRCAAAWCLHHHARPPAGRELHVGVSSASGPPTTQKAGGGERQRARCVGCLCACVAGGGSLPAGAGAATPGLQPAQRDAALGVAAAARAGVSHNKQRVSLWQSEGRRERVRERGTQHCGGGGERGGSCRRRQGSQGRGARGPSVQAAPPWWAGSCALTTQIRGGSVEGWEGGRVCGAACCVPQALAVPM